MPIPYQTYGCRFKCGWRHNKDRHKIYRHEETCWLNPSTKSCPTCKHEELFRGRYDDVSGPEPAYRSCLIDESIEFEEIKPRTFCELWEGKA